MKSLFLSSHLPIILHPYAVFFSWKRPECWATEVKDRLQIYDRLPVLTPWMSDDRLQQAFDVWIYTLSRADILRWIGERLKELRGVLWSGVIKQQTTLVQSELRAIQNAEKQWRAERRAWHKKYPPSSEPAREKPFYSVFDRSNPDYDPDPCDI